MRRNRTVLMAWLSLVVALFGWNILLGSHGNADSEEKNAGVVVRELDGKFRVEIDGELFTEYLWKDSPKPILFPVIGPNNLPMTRNFPMVSGVEGEARDHPHHRSLWFTHGDVNGVDFWAEGPGRGRILHKETVCFGGTDGEGWITTRNAWICPEDQVQCTDTRTMVFRQERTCRMIDFVITIHASEGPVVFGDTKEGSMGIRTHPALRLMKDVKAGVADANGKAINSEGDRGPFGIWGKRAKWVGYWGDIDGKTVGIAIFDHPGNPRHPTWWHARPYGLVAANPFGIHDFEKQPKGTGDMKIPAGEEVTLRYRFLFHEGDVETGEVRKHYDTYAASQQDLKLD